MDIEIIFKIAGIGLVIALLNQILARSEKGEYVMIITLTGVILVFLMLIPYILEFFESIRELVDL